MNKQLIYFLIIFSSCVFKNNQIQLHEEEEFDFGPPYMISLEKEIDRIKLSALCINLT